MVQFALRLRSRIAANASKGQRLRSATVASKVNRLPNNDRPVRSSGNSKDKPVGKVGEEVQSPRLLAYQMETLSTPTLSERSLPKSSMDRIDTVRLPSSIPLSTESPKQQKQQSSRLEMNSRSTVKVKDTSGKVWDETRSQANSTSVDVADVSQMDSLDYRLPELRDRPDITKSSPSQSQNGFMKGSINSPDQPIYPAANQTPRHVKSNLGTYNPFRHS